MKAKTILLSGMLIFLIGAAFQLPSNPLPVMRVTGALPDVLLLSGLYSSLPAAACDSSLYVRDITIGDGTKVKPETVFIKKWRIRNIGFCGWNKKYSLQFVGGERMSGEAVNLTKWVPPGKAIVVSVNMVAPAKTGSYSGYWILTNSSGSAFGSYLTVRLVVSNKVP